MNTKLNDLGVMFKETFNEAPDLGRLQALIDFWGEEKVSNTLHYVYINGYRKPREGEKHNPYGLLYTLCHKLNLER